MITPTRYRREADPGRHHELVVARSRDAIEPIADQPERDLSAPTDERRLQRSRRLDAEKPAPAGVVRTTLTFRRTRGRGRRRLRRRVARRCDQRGPTPRPHAARDPSRRTRARRASRRRSRPGSRAATGDGLSPDQLRGAGMGRCRLRCGRSERAGSGDPACRFHVVHRTDRRVTFCENLSLGGRAGREIAATPPQRHVATRLVAYLRVVLLIAPAARSLAEVLQNSRSEPYEDPPSFER